MMSNADKARLGNHQWFVGDMAVSKGTVEIWNALTAKMPDLIPVEGNRGTRHYLPAVEGKDREWYVESKMLCVAYKDNPKFIVGAIGSYRDESYRVESRLIENNKFARWNSSDFHSRESKFMNKIIKEAEKVLIPFTPAEIASESMTRTRVHSQVNEIGASARHGMTHMVNQTISKIQEEVMNMIHTGYIPCTPEFKELLEYVIKHKESYQEDKSYNPSLRFLKMEGDGGFMLNPNTNALTHFSTKADLPQDMQDKIMVLQLSPENKFVRDIGLRDVEANMYWVCV